MNELEFLKAVAMVCFMYSKNVSRDMKEDCVSSVSNCAVIEDGKFAKESEIKKCHVKFLNQYEPKD